MSEQKKAGSAQKLVPIGAPAIGAVVMIAFVALAFTMGKIDPAPITAKADQVTQKLADPKAVIVTPDSQKFNVRIAEAEKRAGFPEQIKDQDVALAFPLRFRLTLDQAAGPEQTEFEKLDLDHDKTLSLKEFLAKSGETQDRFTMKDKDKNKKLTPEEFAWEPPFVPPTTKFDLAAPANVKAVLDYTNPQVAVTWERPTLADAPEDVAYLVYRASPEYFLKRNTDYREGALKKFLDDANAYDAKYRSWAVGPNAGKTKKQYEEETKDLPPVKPAQPSEWELLTPLPINDVTLTDKTFDLDCAFVYAVRMVTAKDLKPGTKEDPAALKDSNKVFYSGLETFHASEAAVQAGHPIYFPNHTSISYVDATDTLLTVRLTRWHRVGDAWRQVRAKFSAEPQALLLGRNIKVSELKEKDRDGKYTKYDPQVLAEDGNPNDALLESLDANDEINFDSGWRYEEKNGSNDPLISNKTGGIFSLPKATRDPAAAPVAPGAMVNPVEIRLVGVTPTMARFELTRWHQSGKNWYRVVVQQDVKRDAAVGLKGKISDLAKDPKTCTVYDMTDNKAASSAITAIAPQDISLETGVKFVKLNGRVVDLGDSRTLDLFGTQFAE